MFLQVKSRTFYSKVKSLDSNLLVKSTKVTRHSLFSSHLGCRCTVSPASVLLPNAMIKWFFGVSSWVFFFFVVFMISMFFFICWSSNWLVPTWWKIDLAKTTPLFQDYYYFHRSFILIRFWSFYHWQKSLSRENTTYHFWIITKTWWQRGSQIQVWTLKSIHYHFITMSTYFLAIPVIIWIKKIKAWSSQIWLSEMALFLSQKLSQKS